MTETFSHKTVAQFLDELASQAPVPGGGSGAALVGALGAALASMVCNLTVGKPKYADVQGEIQALLAQTEALRARLTALIDEDIAVYYRLSSAYKMPKETEEQKAARTAAIQDILRDATRVPMQIAEACVQVLQLCKPIAEKGNVGAVSDAGVAALLAEAALRSAALNVLINLAAIKDAEFVARERAALESLLAGKAEMKEEIYDLVVSKL
ncbi:MAG: cyclodeaminase/cyclohydrolase family protein [Chloroflexi bacterium]|nr:cyclodeaminase/cyclohydrolase family protein [Chloroflexota bacterium]